ncbi:MAG: PEF-CTERM sorting domain-containing protein [Methanolobus sp.]|nr:PEF-CTERM sorting domain-containing protein [Methanolobus sp.]
MRRIVILTMLMLVVTMSLAAAADICPCGDNNKQLKFDPTEYTALGEITHIDFGNTFVGDNDTLQIPNAGDTFTSIEITIVKEGEGEAIAFNWTSDLPVCSILVKTGDNDDWVSVGGETSGSEEVPGQAAISHITFCFDDGNGSEIPEFPTLALPVAAILGLAFLFQRRKE